MNGALVIYIWTSGYRYETIAKNIISIHNILQGNHGEMLLQYSQNYNFVNWLLLLAQFFQC